MVDMPTDNAPNDAKLDSGADGKLDTENDELSQDELLAMLGDLKLEHRRIDTEITALIDMGAIDMLKIGRMKKIKLSIKDQMSYLENQLTPDIIA